MLIKQVNEWINENESNLLKTKEQTSYDDDKKTCQAENSRLISSYN